MAGDDARDIGVRAVGRATLARAFLLDRSGWALLLLATIGTNLLDFATAPPAGSRPNAGFLIALVVRVVAVFWISYALQRQLASVARPYRTTPALGRFVLLQIALLVPV